MLFSNAFVAYCLFVTISGGFTTTVLARKEPNSIFTYMVAGATTLMTVISLVQIGFLVAEYMR